MEEKKEISIGSLFKNSIAFKVAFMFFFGLIAGLLCACFSLGGYWGTALGISGVFTGIFWIIMLIICITQIIDNFGQDWSDW